MTYISKVFKNIHISSNNEEKGVLIPKLTRKIPFIKIPLKYCSSISCTWNIFFFLNLCEHLVYEETWCALFSSITWVWIWHLNSLPHPEDIGSSLYGVAWVRMAEAWLKKNIADSPFPGFMNRGIEKQIRPYLLVVGVCNHLAHTSKQIRSHAWREWYSAQQGHCYQLWSQLLQSEVKAERCT